MWTIFITGSRWGKFAVDIVTSCWMIYFLGLILHPQRVLRPSAIDDEMEKSEDRKQREIQESTLPKMSLPTSLLKMTELRWT